MRHLQILTLSLLIFFALSPNALAKNFCGFESSSIGRQMWVRPYMSTADVHCRSNGNDQKYQEYSKRALINQKSLQEEAEREFGRRLQSASCRAEFGSASINAKEATDRWLISAMNSYSQQASSNRPYFCAQALLIIDQYLGRSSNVQASSPLTYRSSSAISSAPLQARRTYQAVLPNGYSKFADIPSGMKVYVPGIGYVPKSQIGSVYGTYNGPVKGAQ